MQESNIELIALAVARNADEIAEQTRLPVELVVRIVLSGAMPALLIERGVIEDLDKEKVNEGELNRLVGSLGDELLKVIDYQPMSSPLPVFDAGNN